MEAKIEVSLRGHSTTTWTRRGGGVCKKSTFVHPGKRGDPLNVHVDQSLKKISSYFRKSSVMGGRILVKLIWRGLSEPLPPVDLHWFFEISISAFISNWDKNSVIN